MKRRFFSLLLVIGVLLSSQIVYANYATSFGFSAEGISRGNAMAAVVDNWSSVYYNIAGLGKTVEKRVLANQRQFCRFEATQEKKNNELYNNEIALGYIYNAPFFNFQHPLILMDKKMDSGYINFGLTLDLNNFFKMPSFISSARFGMGGGFNFYYDRNKQKLSFSMANVEDANPQYYNWLDYSKNAQGALIMMGLGFGFLDDLFGVGLGASVWAGGDGKVAIPGLQMTDKVPETSAQVDVKPTVAPTVGLYYQPWAFLKIGANWIGELYMEIDPIQADVIINGESGNPLGAIGLSIGLLDFFTPHAFRLGLASTFSIVTVSLDCEYLLWSRYKLSSAKVKYYQAKKISIPKLRNVFVPHFGIEVSPLTWLSLRLGYTYEPSVLTAEVKKSSFNWLDNDKHICSLGTGFIVPRYGPMVSPLEINLGLQYQYLVKQKIVKEDNSLLIYANLPGAKEIPNYNYSYSGHDLAITLEVITRW